MPQGFADGMVLRAALLPGHTAERDLAFWSAGAFAYLGWSRWGVLEGNSDGGVAAYVDNFGVIGNT